MAEYFEYNWLPTPDFKQINLFSLLSTINIGPSPFTGSFCERPNCNFIQSPTPDPSGCSVSVCNFANIPYSCPKTCGLTSLCSTSSLIPTQCPTFCNNGGTLLGCACLCKTISFRNSKRKLLFLECFFDHMNRSTSIYRQILWKPQLQYNSKYYSSR